MWLSRYRLTCLATALFGRYAPARREPRRQVPLCAELLEDRTTPATITPTTFADGIGIGSLRDAVLQADSNGQSNFISLAPGTYQLSLAGRNESAGKTGDLNLTASGFTQTIEGAAAGTTIINAAQLDRVIEVQSGVTLVLSNLTVTGGLATDAGTIPASDALGGGILNNGNLSLNSVVVTANTAKATPGNNARGGGIYSADGILALTDSTITSNSAVAGNGADGLTGVDGGSGGEAQGGGLYIGGGSLSIIKSVIVHNTARGGNGGNVFIQSGGGGTTENGGTGGNGGNGGNGGHGGFGGFGGGGGPITRPLPGTPGASTLTNFAGPTGAGGTFGATDGEGFTGGGGGGFTGGGGATGGGFTGGGGATGGGATGGGGGATGGGGGATGGGGGSGGSALNAAGRGVGGVGGRAQGGGLYVANGTVHISMTKFADNLAAGGDGGSSEVEAGLGGASQGGGVFIDSGAVGLIDSTLTDNLVDPSASESRVRPAVARR